jgi:catechol 2,3-dioxygenase-like lactoylglutathione lyase family enzyme
MSPNIAVRTAKFAEAVDFYTHVLGFKDHSEDPHFPDFDANPITLFVLEDDEISGPVMELFVNDLESARDKLVTNGCKVLCWKGKGKDCYVQDPFGVIFNLWQDQYPGNRP